MKKLSLFAFSICILFTACNSDDNVETKTPVVTNVDQDLKNEESKNLEKMYDEIVALSGNTNTNECTGDWDFTAIGSKSCGGPKEYIAYSLKINTKDFLAKVRNYTTEQEKFNTKWNITSTCDVVSVPVLAACVNGKVTLLYESDQNTEKENLKKMYEEIVALSENNESCTGNWYFTAIGSRSCGGPEGYIAYSLKINTTDFLSKVRNYTAEQEKFNTKWRITSTCNIVPVPESVACINGKATLLYESDRIAEKQNLQKMYDDIIELSGNTKPCTGNWDFTAIGSKPCGGPESYIAYSLKINTTDFLAKVKTYTAEQAKFNNKWQITSTCETPFLPKSVECINEKATFIYK